MYFLSTEERQLLLKSLLPAAREQVVAPELRGWSWSEPPVAPAYSAKLGVYEVVNKYCETGRDIWWHRVQGVRAEPNAAMVEGKVLHAVVSKIISTAKRLIWTLGVERPGDVIAALREFDELWLERQVRQNRNSPPLEDLQRKANIIWSYEAAMIEARLREALSRQPFAREDSVISSAIPVIVEQRLDGSLLGLSKHLSMDAYQSAEPLILDMKFGEKRDFHKLQVTGYALVSESLYEYPLNIGCIVYPSFDGEKLTVSKEFFLIDEELRQQFLEQRDERMRMVFEEIDPGLMKNCPATCPYYERCYA
jgi:CRISPR-associated protein Csa1